MAILMIVEFFGLSKSGKSTLKRILAQKGYSTSRTSVLKTDDPSFVIKNIFFLKHLILHPLNVLHLFYKLNTKHIPLKQLTPKDRLKISKMRNFYLAAVLSKYEQIKNKKENIFVDEFSFQNLFMILQTKSDKKALGNILNKLPKSDYLFLFERSSRKRHNAYKLPHIYKSPSTLLPGSWINKVYAQLWMNSMEYNFQIIKGIIKEKYKEDKEHFKHLIKVIKETAPEKLGEDKHSFKDLKLKPPKIYVRK